MGRVCFLVKVIGAFLIGLKKSGGFSPVCVCVCLNIRLKTSNNLIYILDNI